MNKYLFADRPECKECVSNKGGSCIALVDTQCEGVCAFRKAKWELTKDAEYLEKRIKEGKIPDKILAKYGIGR